MPMTATTVVMRPISGLSITPNVRIIYLYSDGLSAIRTRVKTAIFRLPKHQTSFRLIYSSGITYIYL